LTTSWAIIVVEDKETGADRPPKKPGRKPIGTASLKLEGGGYRNIGGVFLGSGKAGGYAVIGVTEEVVLPKGAAVFVFFNSKNYKIAFIKRDAILGI